MNSAIIYTVGNFLIKGINFFTLPLFTRMMGTEDYGLFSVFSTWVGIVSIFIGLGIEGTIGIAKNDLKNEEYKKYLNSTLQLATISFFIMLFVIIIFGDSINKILGLNKVLILMILIQSFFAFIINFISAKYTFERNTKNYLKISLLVTILNLLLSIILVFNMDNNKYIGRIMGGVIATAIVGGYLYIKQILNFNKKDRIKYWRYCLPISIPMVFHGLSQLILNHADRIMIQKLMGNSIVGIYSFSYNIAIILNVINLSINNAWVAWYFEALKENLKIEIKKNAKNYMIIFTSITICFLLISPELVKILAPKQYWDGIYIVPLIVLGYYFVFLYTFSVNYEFYVKKTKYIAIGSIIAAFVNLLINYILIPIMGINGAAVATLISYLILFFMHEFIVRRIFKHKDFPFYYYVIAIIGSTLMMFITYIFIEWFFIRLLIISLSLIIPIGLINKMRKKC